MTDADADRLIRTTAVPNWMLYVISALLTVLSSGAVATICITVNWVFFLSHDLGEVKRRQSAHEVKQTDLIHAFESIRTEISNIGFDVKQLQRDLGSK